VVNGGGQERLWEVDFLRGLAVLMMLVSNFVFDLSFFAYVDLSPSGAWSNFAKITAGSFLLLVGISLAISNTRPTARQAGFVKVAKRGAKIFSLGLLISLATWFAVGVDYVVFGILHLIGSGVILAYPFLARPYLSLLTGLLIIAAGWLLKKITVSFSWLLWLGVQSEGFTSVDYTPLLPWFGLILLGVFLGSICFPEGRRKVVLPISADLLPIRLTSKLGTKSLVIYFIHQPILWSGFWVVQWLS
jgi:uncharacterized membrane protein